MERVDYSFASDPFVPCPPSQLCGNREAKTVLAHQTNQLTFKFSLVIIIFFNVHQQHQQPLPPQPNTNRRAISHSATAAQRAFYPATATSSEVRVREDEYRWIIKNMQIFSIIYFIFDLSSCFSHPAVRPPLHRPTVRSFVVAFCTFLFCLKMSF